MTHYLQAVVVEDAARSCINKWNDLARRNPDIDYLCGDLFGDVMTALENISGICSGVIEDVDSQGGPAKVERDMAIENNWRGE